MVEMREVFISWEQFKINQLKELAQCDVFAVVEEGALVYVSHCFGNSLPNELKDVTRALRLNENNLTVWCGTIMNNIHLTVNLSLVEDIACLIVFHEQPLLNVTCRGAYLGKLDLFINNKGEVPIDKIIRTDQLSISVAG